MKHSVLVVLASIAVIGTAEPAISQDKTIYFYNWSNSTSPELLAKFEKETGIKVIVDVFDSNETALAKLKSGTGGYDVLDATSDFLPIYIKEGLLQKIDVASMPGFSNVDPQWQKPVWDPNSEYSLSWYWGTTSYAVDTARYTGPIDSLKVLFDPPPELAGQVGMFSSPTEVISLALTYLGKPQCNTNPDDLTAVQDLLLNQKPSVKIYNSDGIIERMSSGETAISQDWNGDALRGRLARPTLQYAYPKEGVVAWAETLSVPVTAKHPEEAKKFIEFLLQPENAALQSNNVKYSSTITGADAYYDSDMKGSPEATPPSDVKLVFSQPCGEQAIQFYDQIWTRLKN